jgi:hypothetical protein
MIFDLGLLISDLEEVPLNWLFHSKIRNQQRLSEH